jgi:hypothetical protein
MAVIMGLSTDVPPVRRGKEYWRMNVSLLAESTFQDRLRTQWVKWQQHIKYYPDRLTWWDRYVKRMIVSFSFKKDQSGGETE